MTTAATSPNENRRSGLTTALEVAMVLVGLAIGAVFFSSIWSEKASAEIQARFGPSAVVRAS
jgi:NADH:ubiquinone oxidoreductase subunit H